MRFYLSKDIVTSISDSKKPETTALHIIRLWQRDNALWDSTAPFPPTFHKDAFIADFANPNHKSISRYLRRFGFNSYPAEVARLLGPDFFLCRQAIDDMLEQRNKIAHGDPLATSTIPELDVMVKRVKSYCRTADCCSATYFRTKACPVR